MDLFLSMVPLFEGWNTIAIAGKVAYRTSTDISCLSELSYSTSTIFDLRFEHSEGFTHAGFYVVVVLLLVSLLKNSVAESSLGGEVNCVS